MVQVVLLWPTLPHCPHDTARRFAGVTVDGVADRVAICLCASEGGNMAMTTVRWEATSELIVMVIVGVAMVLGAAV